MGYRKAKQGLCLYLDVTALKFTCENMNLSINLKHIYDSVMAKALLAIFVYTVF